MKTLKELLIELDACEEAIEWAGDMAIEEAVEKCHFGNWFLWLARKIDVDDRKIYLAAGHCANTVRHLMNDERSLAVVDAAIAYGEGVIGIDELALKLDAFRATNYTDYAAASARANLITTANIYRKYLGQEIINKVNQMR